MDPAPLATASVAMEVSAPPATSVAPAEEPPASSGEATPLSSKVMADVEVERAMALLAERGLLSLLGDNRVAQAPAAPAAQLPSSVDDRMLPDFDQIVASVFDLDTISDRNLEDLLRLGEDSGEMALLGMAQLAQSKVDDKLPGAPAETEEEVELRQAIEQGLNLNSALGQRFQRAVRAYRSRPDETGSDEFAAYKGSNQQKAEFRQQWLKKRYEEVASRRCASRSWCQVDFTKVEYRPYGYILREQGSRHNGNKT